VVSIIRQQQRPCFPKRHTVEFTGRLELQNGKRNTSVDKRSGV